MLCCPFRLKDHQPIFRGCGLLRHPRLIPDNRNGNTSVDVDSSGALCLKWPDALNGCGLESKAILDELARRNWLMLDPLSPFRKVVEIEMAGENTRLEVIQNIVDTTLRGKMIEGILTSEPDGNFVLIQSRKAEPLLVERLRLNQMKIMRLGSVVPDVFMCQPRNKAHCYRIPAMPSTNSAPRR